MKRRTAMKLLLAGALASSSCGVLAQQVMRIVVPFAAGGGSDQYTRLLANELTKDGLNTIVENKPGASGIIAAEHVSRARPDGTTLFLGTNSTLANNTVLFENLRYDPFKDFTPVSHVAYQPAIIVSRTDVPFATLKDMVAYAKANPGKINRGSPGSGIITNLAPVLFEQMAGIQTLHVPFNGDTPGFQALLGGSIDIFGTTITGALPHVQAGKIRVLGVMDSKRLPQIPDVPTFKESGYGIEAYAWYSLVAPAGTPADVVEKINRAVNAVLKRDDFVATARAMGMEPRGGSAADLGRYVKQEYDRWVPLLKTLDIKKQ